MWENPTKIPGWLPANLTIKHLLAVLVALSAADALVSQSLVALGLGYEGNPFLRGLSARDFLVIKLAGVLVAALLLWDIHRRQPRVAVTAAVLLVAFLTGVVYWNLGIFLRS